jgi:hypothetical protein
MRAWRNVSAEASAEQDMAGTFRVLTKDTYPRSGRASIPTASQTDVGFKFGLAVWRRDRRDFAGLTATRVERNLTYARHLGTSTPVAEDLNVCGGGHVMNAAAAC